MWPHLAAPVTVRCGPVSSGSEEKGLVRAGAKSSRHTGADDQGGATSRRPSGSNSRFDCEFRNDFFSIFAWEMAVPSRRS